MTYSKEILDLNPELKVANIPASKYKNVRAEAAGLTFQSGHEATEISKLILAEECKAIFGLRLQVRFPLLGGVVYVADATYLELRDGKLVPVVVDAKGVKTPAYRNKKKQFKATYGIEITEI